MRKFLLLALAAVVGLCYALPASAQQQADKKFEVSGEVRFRGDFSDNATDFDDDGSADDSGVLWPWRVRAAVHGSFTRNVSAHVEFQNFGFSGDGTSSVTLLGGTSEDFGGETQLYQGWLELGDIGNSSFDLRLGRQELVYGNEFVLGDNDFYNGVTHDGARAAWQYKKWSLDVFYIKELETAGGLDVPFIFPTSQLSDDTDFYGAYAVFKAPKKVGFDAYALLRNNNDETVFLPFLGTDNREERWTYGGRVYSKWDSNWSWYADGAFQTGEFEDAAGTTTDISGAFGLEAELAYQWRRATVRPRVHGRLSVYSGDDDDADESEAFDPLFQDFAHRLGYFDLFRGTNLQAVEVGVSWNGKEDRHIFGVNLLQFTANEETVGGADIGEDDLGTEVDLYYKYAYSRNVQILGAIANFSPGDVFDVSTTADAMPDVVTTGVGADDSAMRVVGNVRLRW